jgi:beta-RFAP synthase
MSGKVVHVAASSRLHIGMFSFGHAAGRQFGGVGLMVDSPQLRLTISPAGQLEVLGPDEAWIRDVVERLLQSGFVGATPNCRIEQSAAPRRHAGLGSGTQLALAVAAGLDALAGRPSRGATELAAATGRGARSAIGVHGFLHGGLLVEAGKHAGDTLGPLVARAELPAEWRFLLLCPPGEGLSGDVERQAFERLPAVPAAVTDALCREALLELLPAAQVGDFDRFSMSLYEFGHRAGRCFASQQGGAYRDRRGAQLVEMVRDLGIAGVGQSSWGPTVFALLPDASAAARTLARLKAIDAMHDVETTIAAARNRGAEIQVTPR